LLKWTSQFYISGFWLFDSHNLVVVCSSTAEWAEDIFSRGKECVPRSSATSAQFSFPIRTMGSAKGPWGKSRPFLFFFGVDPREFFGLFLFCGDNAGANRYPRRAFPLFFSLSAVRRRPRIPSTFLGCPKVPPFFLRLTPPPPAPPRLETPPSSLESARVMCPLLPPPPSAGLTSIPPVSRAITPLLIFPSCPRLSFFFLWLSSPSPPLGRVVRSLVIAGVGVVC